MTDMLANASAWLDRQRAGNLAQTVTYGRGALTVELAATAGQSDHDVEAGEGYIETVRTVDFLLTAEDLLLGGEAVEPEPGDRIAWRDDTYEVLPPGNERCFRFTDPHETTIRVHTKRVEAA